jgi:superkiller protein 3
LAKALLAQKSLKEAVIAFQEAIQLAPVDASAFKANAYNKQGVALSDQGKQYEATIAFQKAIQLIPNYATAYYNLGKVLFAQKKFVEATMAFRKAIQLEPDDALFYLGLGNALLNQLQLDEAKASFQKALSFPDYSIDYSKTLHAVAHNSLGLLYQVQGELEAARQEFSTANEISPIFVFSIINLAVVQQLLKQPVILSFAETRYLNPKDPLTRAKRPVVILTPFFSSTDGGYFSAGTGFIIKREDKKLWIVTNRHVVTYKNDSQLSRTCDYVNVEIYLGNRPNNARVEPLKGQVFKITEDKSPLDLALIEVEASDLPADLQPFEFNLEPQDNLAVSVIGHPGQDEWVNDSGKIIDSADDLLILKIRFDKGNSGSPILDEKNRVVGLGFKFQETGTAIAFPMRLVLQTLNSWGVTVP